MGKFIVPDLHPSAPICWWVQNPPTMSKSTLYYPNYMGKITFDNYFLNNCGGGWG